MAKTKVRSDSHSLYVRTNGSVYRSISSLWSYNNPESGATSSFVENEDVNVYHIKGSPFCKVKGFSKIIGCEIKEVWHSHGSYFEKDSVKQISSENVWNPNLKGRSN